MSKYIIKNCPMYFCGNCYGHTGNCDCSDCTSCVMKQIVERCRKKQEYHKEWQKETGFNYAPIELRLANDILHLLDIQEVE